MAPDPGWAPLFFALGDATRLDLVRRLSDGTALSASALAQQATVTRQAVSKHLGVLEDAGLVSRRKIGREVLFALEQRRIADARAFLDAVAAGWDRAIDRLRVLVEDGDDETG